MGSKYRKKSKITGDISVMEVVSPFSSVGVRTRAKTLALQRLYKSTEVAPKLDEASFCYLQLRSRRLKKPHFPLKRQSKKKVKSHPKRKFGLRVSSANSGLDESVALSSTVKPEEGVFGKNDKAENENENGAVEVEASFGENCLDFEPRDRSSRESTPCNLIMASDAIRTPSSSTRRGLTTNQSGSINMERIVPTTREMDEFFASAEQQQQRLFIEKYNFDIAKDLPLPGRYEWVMVVP